MIYLGRSTRFDAKNPNDNKENIDENVPKLKHIEKPKGGYPKQPALLKKVS